MFEVPDHLLIPVNEQGEGPLDADEKPWALVCWCSEGQKCQVLPAEVVSHTSTGTTL